MKRYRNDSVKPGKGIDETLGERYGKTNVVDQWDYPGNRHVPDDEDIKGRKVRNSPGYAAYTSDDDAPLVQGEDIQFAWGTRDLMADVEANSRPGGDDNTDFDTTGPIRSGVNRSQSDGEKKGGSR